MASTKEQIPTDIAAWEATATRLNVVGTIDQLGSPEKVQSASKFRFSHYIGLRVIWRYGDREDRSSLPQKVLDQLRGDTFDLATDPYWNAHLAEIEAYMPGSDVQQALRKVPESLGRFVNVWQYQRHVLRKLSLSMYNFCNGPNVFPRDMVE